MVRLEKLAEKCSVSFGPVTLGVRPDVNSGD